MTDTAWLIERSFAATTYKGKPQYICIDPDTAHYRLTENPNNALRYARQEDADQTLDYIRAHSDLSAIVRAKLFVAEHM